MAPFEVNVDYYAVLEISNTATLEVITKSYRRLAKIRHPDKTPNQDSSTAGFQLNAYDTISDPEKRRAYDTRLSGIRDGLRAQQEAERRQATAAETERKGATEETAKEQREDDARQEHLRHLELLRDISELRPVVNKLAADLRSLYDQDAEDSRKERERNSWWAYLASHIYGKVKKTDEQKQAQETERLHRIASKSIKVSELREKEAKLQGLQAAARTRAEQEKRERWAKAKKEQAEHAAKEAREAQAARETREAQEPVWKAAAAERHKRDAEERAQEMRAAEEAARKLLSRLWLHKEDLPT